MNTFISITVAIMIACTGTVNSHYNQNKQEGTEKNSATESKTSAKEEKLAKLKKDPLYPFIAKQNKLTEKNDIMYIKNEANLLVLANKDFSLQPTYAPTDLVVPDVKFSFGDQKIEKAHMRKTAADHLKEMFQAAQQDGHTLFAVSGYRSYKRQQQVFQAEVSSKGDKAAREAVAFPGTSEHQTGLAMDISSESQSYELTSAFGETPEGKWLMKNAHQFGFILRYMKGKEAITKYEYESWHYRYVGKDAATIIYQHDWTLEEFFDHVHELEQKINALQK